MRTNWVQNAIAKRMREAAREAGMSAPQIAERMGVAVQTIYRWWEGERSPSPEKVEKYADVVGKDAAWMYGQVDQDQLVCKFTDWMLRLVDEVRAGVPVLEAYDRVTGAPNELSLRERRKLAEGSEALSALVNALPDDADALPTVVGPRGQIVIEEPIREQLGIQPGWQAVQVVVDNHVEIYFMPPEHKESLLGAARPFIRRQPAPNEDWDEAVAEAAVEDYLRKSDGG
jgi:transcriptional regulator with XRE-family HTH domain